MKNEHFLKSQGEEKRVIYARDEVSRAVQRKLDDTKNDPNASKWRYTPISREKSSR